VECDVVVVGGGSAGCVVAAGLSEEPDRSVCLTCAFGSVTDERTCVLGLENVYVADASLILQPVRANTNWTVMAVAEWVSTLV
jgi:choline dehydrogenase-like flavoprotein